MGGVGVAERCSAVSNAIRSLSSFSAVLQGAVNVTRTHTQIPRLTFECQLPELLSVP